MPVRKPRATRNRRSVLDINCFVAAKNVKVVDQWRKEIGPPRLSHKGVNGRVKGPAPLCREELILLRHTGANARFWESLRFSLLGSGHR
jgi:hypothetical protein